MVSGQNFPSKIYDPRNNETIKSDLLMSLETVSILFTNIYFSILASVQKLMVIHVSVFLFKT